MWIEVASTRVVVQLEGERVASSGGVAAKNLRDASLELVHQMTTRLSAFNPIKSLIENSTLDEAGLSGIVVWQVSELA
jgi:hypothetical protein